MKKIKISKIDWVPALYSAGGYRDSKESNKKGWRIFRRRCIFLGSLDSSVSSDVTFLFRFPPIGGVRRSITLSAYPLSSLISFLSVSKYRARYNSGGSLWCRLYTRPSEAAARDRAIERKMQYLSGPSCTRLCSKSGATWTGGAKRDCREKHNFPVN